MPFLSSIENAVFAVLGMMLLGALIGLVAALYVRQLDRDEAYGE